MINEIGLMNVGGVNRWIIIFRIIIIFFYINIDMDRGIGDWVY